MSPMMSVQFKSADNGMMKLAEKLVRRLGVEDALRACRENSWHGVRRIIEGQQSDRAFD